MGVTNESQSYDDCVTPSNDRISRGDLFVKMDDNSTGGRSYVVGRRSGIRSNAR